jgi:DNA-binding SARP family transcriptional activator
MTTLSLELLGGFRLQTHAREPVLLPSKKARALLAYLALQPGQAHVRAKLAALLWGDFGDAQARDSLRQTLSLVRKALSEDHAEALMAQADAIVFQPAGFTIDAVAFEHLAGQSEPENLASAVELYRGDLLDGLHIPAPEFESWATAERQRFREMALEALGKLLDHHLAAGAVERSIHVAARLLALDPLQESAHRTLMELFCKQGRYAAAMRQYRRCAELLVKELGIAPDAATQALHRDIIRRWHRGNSTTTPAQTSGPPAQVSESETPSPPHALERR